MSEFNHSPAPWSFDRDSDGNMEIRDANGQCFQNSMKYYPWNSKNEADWKLQAAAPELLEALELFLSHSDPQCAIWRNVHNVAVMAIAKARDAVYAGHGEIEARTMRELKERIEELENGELLRG